MDKFEELANAHAQLLKPLPDWEEGRGRADHAFAAAQTLPFTVWETEYEWADADKDVLADVKVVPITVTTYDILPGASMPTAEYRYAGRPARSSIKSFYCTEADARAEANYQMAVVAQRQANADFDRLSRELMPQLLAAVRAAPQE